VTGAPGLVPPPADDVARLAHTPRLLVCCDYDGTLADIVDDPALAYPHPLARPVLEAFAALPSTTVALLSGRSLDDLATMSGAPHRVLLIGSHGWESEHEVALDPDRERTREQVLAECRAIVAEAPGARLEVKSASVAVHVRQASRDVAARVEAEVLAGPGGLPGVRVIHGKEVVELAVVEVDKGHAVEALRARAHATATLFLGDDVTDEAAFAVLGGDDVGVKVGPGPTSARHRVASPEDAVALLDRVQVRRRAWVDRTSAWQDG
jgi:trehalose-phosphatase